MSNSPTYWEYLQVNDLLKLQGGLEGDDKLLNSDELNFIIVHQVYELWFKQVIRELTEIIKVLSQPRVEEQQIPKVVHRLNRIVTILKLSSDHFELMETMTPQDFMEFRGKLGTASGFQSFQLRQIELLIGLEPSQMVKLGSMNPLEHLEKMAPTLKNGEMVWEIVKETKESVSLKQLVEEWLFRTPIDGSSPTSDEDSTVVERFIKEYAKVFEREQNKLVVGLASMGIDEHEKLEKRFEETKRYFHKFLRAEDVPEDVRWKQKRVRAAILFIESYRKLPLLSWPRILLDKLIELEEHMVIFRARHARMVERMIGRRIGTGGSSGVDYLDKTTSYRIFTNLWRVRTILLQENILPSLEHPKFYDFVQEQ